MSPRPAVQYSFLFAVLLARGDQCDGGRPGAVQQGHGRRPVGAGARRARIFEDVVVAPIPISNPTVGTGLAVVVMPFYHLGQDSPLSNTAVAAGVISSGSWGVGVAQSTRLRGDALRLDGFLGYVDLRYRFYGAGADAGTDGTSVPIVQKALAFAPELLFQVATRTFLGLRYRGVRVETALEDEARCRPPSPRCCPSSITINSSGFGPRATLDTRDNDMNPVRRAAARAARQLRRRSVRQRLRLPDL